MSFKYGWTKENEVNCTKPYESTEGKILLIRESSDTKGKTGGPASQGSFAPVEGRSTPIFGLKSGSRPPIPMDGPVTKLHGLKMG